MTGPGPKNAITDVPGIRVGQAEDRALMTGVTVVLPDAPAIAAADVRGGGPGTRETDLLRPDCTVERVDAVALSGGSAYGLDAAGGVMDWLRGERRGFRVGGEVVPIVPAAILYDLGRGERQGWDHPPWWTLGREAAASADTSFRLGTAGAGTGALAGGIAGGIGTASIVDDGITVGALAVANPLGSVVMPGTRSFWAWWLEEDGEFGDQQPPSGRPERSGHVLPPRPRTSTTLAVVGTDAALTKADALRIAAMAQDGIARAIRPVHTPLDGDVVFVLSTGAVRLDERVADLSRIGSHAADCVARAITRGVYEAEAHSGLPCWKDL